MADGAVHMAVSGALITAAVRRSEFCNVCRAKGRRIGGRGEWRGCSIIPALMGLQAGTKLGNYEIGAPLGTGGMGEVYRARDLSLQREVAIKILPASFSRDTDRLRRFTQEAQATAVLNHPNILSVYQIGQENARRTLCGSCWKGRACGMCCAMGQCRCASRWNMERKSREGWQPRRAKGSCTGT
jgi:hypothetical protein